MHPTDNDKNPTVPTFDTPTSRTDTPHPKIRTLADLRLPKLTPNQQKDLFAEQAQRNQAIRDSLRKWTPEDVKLVISAFKTDFANDYDRITQQEIHKNSIDSDLALIVTRLTQQIFHTSNSLELNSMLREFRREVRMSLNLLG